MNPVKAIRERLGVTQQSMATGLGCTQGNVGNYEAGQAIPPPMASKLIDYAASLGLRIGFDHIYGGATLPTTPCAKPELADTPAKPELAEAKAGS